MDAKTINFSPSRKIETSEIYQIAKEVCNLILQKGFSAYFVGGSVRDFILFPRCVPHDVDIATCAGVQDIENLFPNTTLVGKSFGVCVVKYKKISFEVATFRKDGPYLDRRHPSYVSVGTLEEDSLRRDYTMNALYFSPQDKQIIDFHGGLNDLKHKIIRCVGHADDRIYEDALRIFRCLRFSTQFNFKIEKSLLTAIQIHKDGLKLLPMERILGELGKVHHVQGFVEKFYNLLDISLFFKNLSNNLSSSRSLQLSSRNRPSPRDLTMGLTAGTTVKINQPIKKFKFSEKSVFFDFFVMFCIYYHIDNMDALQQEIKIFPCSVYDKKLCVWFLNVIEKGSLLHVDSVQKISTESSDITKTPAFLFFKDLLVLERIEKCTNSQIFLILKKLINVKYATQIITKYIKTNKSFSMNLEIEKLRVQKIPEQLYSSQILLNRFQNIYGFKS